MRIRIEYDGKVSVSSNHVYLGEHSLDRIISSALRIREGEYSDINAGIDIFINRKPDAALVTIEGDDKC